MLHPQTANARLAGIAAMTAQIAAVLGPALDEPGALQQPSTVHVRYGSQGDIFGVGPGCPLYHRKRTSRIYEYTPYHL